MGKHLSRSTPPYHASDKGRSSRVNPSYLAIPARNPDFGGAMNEIRPTPPEPLTAEEELAPPGTPLSLTVVPGLLDQQLFAIREDGDTDEDFEASKRLLTAVLDFARKG